MKLKEMFQKTMRKSRIIKPMKIIAPILSLLIVLPIFWVIAKWLINRGSRKNCDWWIKDLSRKEKIEAAFALGVGTAQLGGFVSWMILWIAILEVSKR